MQNLAAALILGGMLAATGAIGAAQADPDNTIPIKVSEKVLADLARADLDATATDCAKYLGQTAAEGLKNSFASLKNLGQSQYTEEVYSRDYGHTEKDMIYKIDFQKAFAYVRFTWQVDNGDWHLVHLAYKTENELPFPSGWEHIYPK
jgi:hypothetical protein